MALEQYACDARDCSASSQDSARDLFVGPGHLILFQAVTKSLGHFFFKAFKIRLRAPPAAGRVGAVTSRATTAREAATASGDK